jgi:hypothetical protein
MKSSFARQKIQPKFRSPLSLTNWPRPHHLNQMSESIAETVEHAAPEQHNETVKVNLFWFNLLKRG